MARHVPTVPGDKASKPRDQSRSKHRAEHHAELLTGLANQHKRAESRAAAFEEADAYSVQEFCHRRNR
jgi:hypothetical protein